MSEPIGESTQRTVEVIRKPNYDVILNLAPSRQRRVQEALGAVEAGLPSSWPVFHPEGEGESTSFRVDSLVDPTFFAKERHLSDPSTLSQMLERSRSEVERAEDVEQKNKKTYEYRKDIARSSLVNEIASSSLISRVLGTSEVETLVRALGFKSIEFVEPLVGVIDRVQKRKTLVYRFVDGRRAQTSLEQQALAALSKSLVESFLQAGIVPADLNTSQYLLGRGENEGKIYLLDSELYFKNN